MMDWRNRIAELRVAVETLPRAILIALRESPGYTVLMLGSKVLVGVDLTRFGGYLISWEKGDPLCRQHVHLIHLSMVHDKKGKDLR